jgi:hypothetical protein
MLTHYLKVLETRRERLMAATTTRTTTIVDPNICVALF